MKEKTIIEFSELTSSKNPTPGGGGVSALVASLASSLSQMVINLTIGKKKFIPYTNELVDLRKELEVLRLNLLDCIDLDEQAFLPLAAAYKMDKEDPDYEKTMEECLRNAANPPMYVLKYAKRIIELDEQLLNISSKLAISDIATSVMLAQGTLYGAYVNILVNTNLMKDREYADAYTKEAIDIVDEYSVLALNVYDEACKRITNG